MLFKRIIFGVLLLSMTFAFEAKAQSSAKFYKDSVVFSLKMKIKIKAPFALKSEFSVGVKATENHTWKHYDASQYRKEVSYSNWHFNPALVLDWRFSKYFSLGIEPTMIQGVCRTYTSQWQEGRPNIIIEWPYGTQPIDIQMNTNYLALPLLLKARFPIFKNNLLISPEFGYSFAWFVSGKRIETPANTALFPVRETKLNRKNSSDINHYDEGLNVGLGFSIPLKRSFIDVNARYYKGQKDVNKYQFESSKNQIVSYQLGYRVTL
jgi:hypothetical protein